MRFDLCTFDLSHSVHMIGETDSAVAFDEACYNCQLRDPGRTIPALQAWHIAPILINVGPSSATLI